MNLLLLSDSHGNTEQLMGIKRRLKEQGKVDAILFAGDGHGDMSRLNAEFDIFEVRGNCDLFSRQPDQQLITLLDTKIFLAHGHLLGVKRGLDRLAAAAREKGAKYAVYGHNHVQEINLIAGVQCINPGALINGEYAILNLADGRLRFFNRATA